MNNDVSNNNDHTLHRNQFHSLQSPSNIDTCHSQCSSSSANDFVTLTESDTDTPIAIFDGVELMDSNLTNYSRWVTNDSEIIYDIDSYLISMKLNLSIYYHVSDDDDIFISVKRQIDDISISVMTLLFRRQCQL